MQGAQTIQTLEDVARVAAQYSQALAENPVVAQLFLDAKSIKDAQKFAKVAGEELAAAMLKDGLIVSEEVLEAYFYEMLKADHAAIAQCCEGVQALLYSRLGLQVQPSPIALDADRVGGLAAIAKAGGIKAVAADQLINFSLAVVDQSVKANARIASSVGIATKVIRTAEATACDWCKERAGVYDYAQVSATGSDVWLRHDRCRCLIDVRYSRQKYRGR